MTTPSILVGHIATRQIVVLSLKKKRRETGYQAGNLYCSTVDSKGTKKTSVKDVLKKEKNIKLCLCDHTVDY